MFRSPTQAYDQANKATESNRRLEAAALFKTARMLEDCRKAWDAPDRRDRLREALRLNQRLWTLFQGELTQPGHQLPEALRRDLLQLSLFVDKRTFEVMADPSPDKLKALIDINRHLATGLSVDPAGEPPAREAA